MKSKKQKAKSRNHLAVPVHLAALFLLSAFCFLLFSCRSTVGVSRVTGGYAEVAPTVANEMIIDSNQIVVIDVRTPEAFNGPQGHIAGALNAPFETIESQLPELYAGLVSARVSRLGARRHGRRHDILLAGIAEEHRFERGEQCHI